MSDTARLAPNGATCTLSSFKRKSNDLMRRMKETGEPVVLTVNGEAELVVQDVRSYQRLLELVERLETIEAIRTGLEEMKAGKGRPAAEFFSCGEGHQ